MNKIGICFRLARWIFPVALVSALSLSAQVITLQDNFSYAAVGNINGQAPTTGAGTWAAYCSTADISTNGSQALMDINSGTPGSGVGSADYAFTPASNTLYTLRITFSFGSNISSSNAPWAGFGFTKATGADGGDDAGNNGPWMSITPQFTVGGGGTAKSHYGTNSGGTYTFPAVDYSNPITATITWNTSTGVAQFYINNILQTALTVTSAPTASTTYYAFFMGHCTGSDVRINNITLDSQPLPTPLVIFGPAYPHASTGLPANDFWKLWAPTNTEWPSAQSHTNVILLSSAVFVHPTPGENPVDIIDFLAANNLQLAIPFQMLIRPTRGPSGSAGCGVGEGYDTARAISDALHDISAAITSSGTSVTLNYVPMDEPLIMGVEPPPAGPRWSCQLSFATAASQVAAESRLIRSVFPHVKFIETEPLDPNSIPTSNVLRWLAALRTAGVTLAGFEDDIYSGHPEAALAPTYTELAKAGLPWGVTFLAGPFLNPAAVVESDAVYMANAEENVQIYNASGLAPPPAVVRIQNWAAANPAYDLPETSPTAWSSLVDYFFASPYALEPPPQGCHYLYKTYPNGPNFYTTSASEIAAFEGKGYTDSGRWYEFGLYPNTGGAAYLVPLHRLYDSKTNAYAYTCDPAEESDLERAGFVVQETQGYVWPNSPVGRRQGGEALYACHLAGNGQYFYTPDARTYDNRVHHGGWTPAGNNPVGSGVECYIMPRWTP